MATLRAAFGAAPLQADVLSVASQLASSGKEVVDELMRDVVDPETFVVEVTTLLAQAGQQQRELSEALTGLGLAGEQSAQVERVLRERAMAMAQVEEILGMARMVQQETQ